VLPYCAGDYLAGGDAMTAMARTYDWRGDRLIEIEVDDETGALRPATLDVQCESNTAVNTQLFEDVVEMGDNGLL
jgi:hypothetical protein